MRAVSGSHWGQREMGMFGIGHGSCSLQGPIEVLVEDSASMSLPYWPATGAALTGDLVNPNMLYLDTLPQKHEGY